MILAWSWRDLDVIFGATLNLFGFQNCGGNLNPEMPR